MRRQQRGGGHERIKVEQLYCISERPYYSSERPYPTNAASTKPTGQQSWDAFRPSQSPTLPAHTRPHIPTPPASPNSIPQAQDTWRPIWHLARSPLATSSQPAVCDATKKPNTRLALASHSPHTPAAFVYARRVCSGHPGWNPDKCIALFWGACAVPERPKQTVRESPESSPLTSQTQTRQCSGNFAAENLHPSELNRAHRHENNPFHTRIR